MALSCHGGVPDFYLSPLVRHTVPCSAIRTLQRNPYLGNESLLYPHRAQNLWLPAKLIQGYKPFCLALSKTCQSATLPLHSDNCSTTMTLRIQICCPHCDGKAIARSSRKLSITLREIDYQCVDPECGHTYTATLEIVRTLSPSGKPNAAVNLPYSPAAIRKREQAQIAVAA